LPAQKFDVDAVSVGDLFTAGNPVFQVPHYQRPYSWTIEQVGQLWDDLLAAIDDGEDDYFLGAVVLWREDSGKFAIIDGQQRLATLAVALAALRDEFAFLDEEANAEEIHRLIVRTTLRRDTEPILLLRGDEGQHLARQIQPRIAERDSLTATSRRPRRGRPRKIYIRQAFDWSRDLLRQQTETLNPRRKLERLTEIAEFIRDKTVLIRTVVGSDTDAYIVFETLNDRGLDLSIADLVKNHLFSVGRRRLDEMIGLWEQTTSYIVGLSFARFLRHYWLSKHARVTERRLFTNIKEHLRAERLDGHIKFATDLSTEASLYRSLLLPAASDPQAPDLTDLKEMGIMQHLPLLLAAKSKGLADSDVSELLQVIQNLTMRYLIVGERNPNRLEASYSDWAIKIRNEGQDAIPYLRADAQSLCPPDEEFEDGFLRLTGLRTATARYILRKINENRAGRELRVAGPSEVNVEHILPQNPPQDWGPGIPDDRQERKLLAERLGNLTLLHERLNKEASNRPFDAKVRDYYSRSRIEITKDLRGTERWDGERY
jgi:hypothetical protein